MTQIPTLTTDRLILRAPEKTDFPAYGAVMQSDRAIQMGGPFSAEDAWLDFCAGVAGWHLNGFGTWSISPKDHDEFLGLIFLHHDFGDPERELGWILVPTAEGKNIAFEAATAARVFAYETLGWTTVVSYIHRDNTRSRTLAERMGATVDVNAKQPAGDEPCLVYRHPAPKVIQ